jgi:aspartate-semialdehyde dehydrogenase
MRKCGSFDSEREQIRMSAKMPGGILGATGAVGQKFIKLVEDHPQFEVTEVVASEGASGKLCGDAVSWKQATPIPQAVRAQCSRVPAEEGYTESVSVKLAHKTTAAEIAGLLRSFSGVPQQLQLPNAPEQPFLVMGAPDRLKSRALRVWRPWWGASGPVPSLIFNSHSWATTQFAGQQELRS